MVGLERLLKPKSIVVIGGGVWCSNIIEQCRKIGFEGDIWSVHPRTDQVAGLRCYKRLEDLPSPPDATFIGINRFATIEAVKVLSDMGAGGAVCFASGFLEAAGEDAEGVNLQRQLLEAAGEMPILGPNCYGFINYLDGALLWPDQHGGERVDTGVAILTQSSNIAISLTMQRRVLPIAYVVTVGNQCQQSLGEIGAALLADERVTALGLHIEGFGDLRAFEALAMTARKLGKPIVALKVGKSTQAQTATISHTASLAGMDAGAQALLDRLAIPRVNSLPEMLESLKLLHMFGKLRSNNIASVSCSGGEASLCADLASDLDITFPPLTRFQREGLAAALGPKVALANPLDYHTYIWNDVAAMTAAFRAIMEDPVALTLIIVDFPRPDRCNPKDWACTVEAALNCAKMTDRPIAMVSTLPENMPEEVAHRLLAGGVAPVFGLNEALVAAEAASFGGGQNHEPEPILLPQNVPAVVLQTEAEAKAMLARFGVSTPASAIAISPEEAASAARDLGFPVVLKGIGFAHKTEAGAVCLNLKNGAEVYAAAAKMPCTTFLVEEMVGDSVAELLIGVTLDPAHGYVLTLGAGGVLTEIMRDRQSLLIPASRQDIKRTLQKLRVAVLIDGYRGVNGADYEAIVDAALSVQNFVVENAGKVAEVEINPLLCGVDRAVAADALIRLAKEIE